MTRKDTGEGHTLSGTGVDVYVISREDDDPHRHNTNDAFEVKRVKGSKSISTVNQVVFIVKSNRFVFPENI